LPGALSTLTVALEEAQLAGDPAAEASAWSLHAAVGMQSVGLDMAEIQRESDERGPAIEALGNPRALVALRRLQLALALMSAKPGPLERAAQRLLEAARAAGDRPNAVEGTMFVIGALFFGSEHVDRSLVRVEQLTLAATTESRWTDGEYQRFVAEVHRLAGRTDEAAAARERAIASFEQIGYRPWADQARTRLAALRP
jgi:hypothetical protein